MKITVPASLDEAIDTLTGVDRLLTAKQWERAAIVAAFVTVAPNGKGLDGQLSAQEFADHGISGLSSDKTVRHYVSAWESTGLPKPRPGEAVTLPTSEFPSRKTKADDIATQPGAVAKALENPAFRKKVIDKASDSTVNAIVNDVPDERMDYAKQPKAYQSPEGKAFKQYVAATNTASDKIPQRILAAATLLTEALNDWDEFWPAVAPVEKQETWNALGNIVVRAETLRMNAALDLGDAVTENTK